MWTTPEVLAITRRWEDVKARQIVLAKRSTYTHPLSDWSELLAGEQVEVVKDARVVAAGHVEEVSVSGGVLWILQNGVIGPRQFLKSDGVIVRRARLAGYITGC